MRYGNAALWEGEEGAAAITHAVSTRYAPNFLFKVSFSKFSEADVIIPPQIMVCTGHEYGGIVLVWVSYEAMMNTKENQWYFISVKQNAFLR